MPKLVDACRIAERHQVTTQTVLTWARQGRIPSVRRPGCRKVLFSASDVEHALLSGRRHGDAERGRA